MIGFFEYQYLKYKKSHLKNLVALANVDGHVDDTEIKYLHEIGKKYGLKEKQILEILYSEEKYQVEIPDKFYQRVGQLYDIVGMMVADEVIDDKEMDFCVQMCEKMRLDKTLIEEMVKLYKDGGIQDFEEWENFIEWAKKFDKKK